jgi:hypothetical protein
MMNQRTFGAGNLEAEKIVVTLLGFSDIFTTLPTQLVTRWDTDATLVRSLLIYSFIE